MSFTNTHHRGMLTAIPAFLLMLMLLALSAEAGRKAQSRDVCVIGGGVSGCGVASRLKEQGYSVVVIEKEPELGGCCNTVYFDPPSPGDIDWIDIGVFSFFNTTALNALGLGNWTDTIAYFNKFDVDLIPVPLSPNFAAYYGNFRKGTVVVPAAFSPQEFEAALIRHLTFVSRYPWANTMIEKPDPIPSELLITFEQYILQNQLQPLLPVFNSFLLAVTTNFSDFTVFHALGLGVNAATFTMLLDANLSFIMNEGCYTLYEGYQEFLGAKNVLTNAVVTSVKRPSRGSSAPAIIKGHLNTGRRTPFQYKCDSVVMALPPVAPSLPLLDLDHREFTLFKDVDYFKYYVTAVDTEGPLAQKDYTLFQYDASRPLYHPKMPAVTQFLRFVTYGPSVMVITADEGLPPNVLLAQVQNQIDHVNETFFTKVTVDRKIESHQFWPHFKSSSLAASPTPYTRYADIQGYRNTYWYTSMDTGAGHTWVVNLVESWVDSHFPSKSDHHHHDHDHNHNHGRRSVEEAKDETTPTANGDNAFKQRSSESHSPQMSELQIAALAKHLTQRYATKLGDSVLIAA